MTHDQICMNNNNNNTINLADELLNEHDLDLLFQLDDQQQYLPSATIIDTTSFNSQNCGQSMNLFIAQQQQQQQQSILTTTMHYSPAIGDNDLFIQNDFSNFDDILIYDSNNVNNNNNSSFCDLDELLPK